MSFFSRASLRLTAGACLALAAACSDTPANSAPVVNAGEDQTVFETRSITLSGTVTDPDSSPILAWRQVGGPTVELAGTNTLTPSFETPTISSDTSLVFELSASDTVNPAVLDTVTINIRNVDPIGVVSPPNPHIFPLLLALAEDAKLPVTLYPITSGSKAQPIFESGEGDVLFVFTYIGANERVTGAIPDLTLIYPFMWRGFFEVINSGVTSFVDLIGETVAVAGPIGTSENGGGDLIFRAAAKRQFVDPDTDLNVVYYDGIEAGAAAVASGEAAGIAVPSPATAGVVALGIAQGHNLAPAIDFQEIFNGPASFPEYRSIPEGQMPLGGAHASAAALATPGKRAAIELLLETYADAANRLTREPSTYAPTIAAEFTAYYEPIGAPPAPAPTITASILNNALLYRSDITVGTVKYDLNLWITELLGADPGDEFYDTSFGPY